MKRKANIDRTTKETSVSISLDIDATYQAGKIKTGLGMFDHMLDLFSFHAGCNLEIVAKEYFVTNDAHHLIEDVAICLGNCIKQVLVDKAGIVRYGSFLLPMDEALSMTVIDISSRPFHVFKADFNDAMVGDFPMQMAKHFFYSVAINASITLHQQIMYGSNDHHKLESLFKGFGKSLQQAWQISGKQINSTKGVL